MKFTGTDFELLEGLIDDSKFEYDTDSDGSAVLTNFDLEVYFPITLITTQGDDTASLKALIAAGSEKGSQVYLKMNTKYGTFKNTKSYGFFEDALIDIQNALLKNIKIKTCLSCKHSNYHPLGSGMFGSLHCFKNVEDEKFSNKSELMHLWEKAVLEQKLFNVNEVHVCSEHQFVTESDWTYKDYPT